jgi:hypothetical protein
MKILCWSIQRRKIGWLVIIPLILSAFTHLWNPLGFPSMHVDESHYLRRSMHVLQGLGPQESVTDFDNPHDHPYFGQLFLASILMVVGYPHSLGVSSINLHSIEMLYLLPRVLMGILAVFDTFLVYKIAERRYNRNIALLASVIFAVTPLTWLLRRIFLDNILLPFLLLSVLSSLYAKLPASCNNRRTGIRFERRTILIIFSGIFLGLAILTKIPAFSFIPIVGFLIYTNSNRDLKTLGIWCIPVILIPAIWPVYNISIGQYDNWMNGILWQATQRPDKPLLSAAKIFFEMDPLLFLLGIGGLFYVSLIGRKLGHDSLLLLMWIIPYILFLYVIGWVSYFHWIMVLPALSIAGALILVDLASKISYRVGKKRLFYSIIISSTIVFGLISTTILLTTQINSSYFEVYAYLAQKVVENDEYLSIRNDNKTSSYGGDQITMIGHRWAWAFSWIPKYVYQGNVSFISFNSTNPVNSDRFLLLVDDFVRRKILDQENEDPAIERTRMLYNNSKVIGEFTDKEMNLVPKFYPYTNLGQDVGIYNKVEVRSNK